MKKTNKECLILLTLLTGLASACPQQTETSNETPTTDISAEPSTSTAEPAKDSAALLSSPFTNDPINNLTVKKLEGSLISPKWTINIKKINNGCSITDDLSRNNNNIYFNCYSFPFMAVNSSGQMVQQPVDHPNVIIPGSGPKASSDGTVIVELALRDQNLNNLNGQTIAAIGDDLKTKWVYDVEESSVVEPYLCSDGTVISSSYNEEKKVKRTVAIKDGQKLWEKEPRNNPLFHEYAPGKIVMSDGKAILGIDLKTGDVLWQSVRSLDNPQMATSNQNVIYTGMGLQETGAINAHSGEVIWVKKNLNDGFKTITYNKGTLYVGGDWYTFHAINASNGKLLWQYDLKNLGHSFNTTPIVDGANNIYVGNEDGHIYIFSNTGKLLGKYKTGGKITADSVMTKDGTIVFGGEDGMLYAFQGKPL